MRFAVGLVLTLVVFGLLIVLVDRLASRPPDAPDGSGRGEA